MPNIIRGSSEKLKKMREADAKIVKGIFYCMEPKGGDVTFSYRKYIEDPVVKYTLKDGMQYDLPIGVVKHLNNCGWDIHANILDKDGNPIVGVGKRERRFTFQGTEFM